MMPQIPWGVRAVILTLVFLGSGLLFLFFLIAISFTFPGAGPPDHPMPEPETSWVAIFGLVATGLTSLTTLAGLILGLQKERRESRKSDLEARRLELELERADLELDTLRKQRSG